MKSTESIDYIVTVFCDKFFGHLPKGLYQNCFCLKSVYLIFG
jgi:hypothetical protein